MKPRLLLAHLCDLCPYSWKAAYANRFRRYYLLKNKLSDQMIIQLFHFAKLPRLDADESSGVLLRKITV